MPDQVETEAVETPNEVVETAETNETASAPAARPVAFDRDALAAKLEKKMASAFADEDAAAEVEETETPAKETEVEEKPADEAGKEETTETESEAEAAAPVAGAKPASDAPTLPAAYRRSLKAYEWTDEEIESAIKQGGQNFIATAAKIHANRNKEVQQWAEAGRAARQQTTSTEQAATAKPSTPELLKPVDVEALKKQYGDEALVENLAGPVNRAIEQINRIMPLIHQSQQQSKMAELETLGKQVDGFFGGKEMEPYHEAYGTDTAKLSNEQLSGRQKVLELADALIGGAKMQGRSLTLGDALQLAFDSVSGPAKTQAARAAITKQLKVREKGISLKPSSRGTQSLGGGSRQARNDAERLSNVSKGLKAAFG